MDLRRSAFLFWKQRHSRECFAFSGPAKHCQVFELFFCFIFFVFFCVVFPPSNALHRMQQCCKSWFLLCRSGHIWKQLYISHFGPNAASMVNPLSLPRFLMFLSFLFFFLIFSFLAKRSITTEHLHCEVLCKKSTVPSYFIFPI